MLRIALLTVMMLVSLISWGQNISVTFTATGAAIQIDSITATNLGTNMSVTFPGDKTLLLISGSGVQTFPELQASVTAFPNPFSGRATFSAIIQKPQTVDVKIQNLIGQIVAQGEFYIQSGQNYFDVSVARPGIYVVRLTTDKGTTSCKVICHEATVSENRIRYAGVGSDNQLKSELKSSQTSYTLGYSVGDIILYRCKSGIYVTMVSDSPVSSKNYVVEFYPCTDEDGRSYSIVRIGDQIWMAENLAWLPAVSQYSRGSSTEMYFYVNGYDGYDLNEAKATTFYKTYGVLYNWPAAMQEAAPSNSVPSGVQGACPAGWHLPGDEEWKVLEKQLGMSNTDADSGGWRKSGSVSGKLKESGLTHWMTPNTAATNFSAFTSLPAGRRDNDGMFGLSFGTAYWTTTVYDGTSAWTRYLLSETEAVGRFNHSRYLGISVRCVRN